DRTICSCARDGDSTAHRPCMQASIAKALIANAVRAFFMPSDDRFLFRRKLMMTRACPNKQLPRHGRRPRGPAPLHEGFYPKSPDCLGGQGFFIAGVYLPPLPETGAFLPY
ncbi:hypothetical protein, partial [Microbulbifer sp. JSM ZJ756]|uniref:hypothetical protein n=1 Tax=Microbulbifer sp. JSM ZJ756 TaxID=3376191 RepID=UPI00378811A0